MDHARARGRGVALSIVLAVLAGAFVAAATNGASAASSSTVVAATVPSVTILQPTDCASGTSDVTDFGNVMPGSANVTGTDCIVEFGSSIATSMLLMYQADGGGDAMLPGPSVSALGSWPMNGTLSDLSATGNDGDPLPAAPDDPDYIAASGGRDRAMHFDGSDVATIPYDFSYDVTSFTVDGWIRTTDTIAVIAARESTACGIAGLCAWEWWLTGGRLQMEIEVAGATKSATTPGLVNDGVWHHVAMTVDDAGKELRLYVDGTQVAIDSNWAAGSPDTGNAGIVLGVNADGFDDYTGDLDELRLQAGVRSANDIRSYAAGRVRDYADGSYDWDTPIATTNQFGVCLDSVADGAQTNGTTFVPNPGCAKTDGTGWRALAAKFGDPTAKVAVTPFGDDDGTAHLRFGFRASSVLAPGRYEVPVVFAVVAPAV